MTTRPAGTAPSSRWQNRIVGHAEIAPASLVPNPRNWRTHPDDQQRALSGALAEVGWVAEVLVNRTTGHVVDGHLRLELALARGEPTVPVTYVALSEDEERLVLASLDPIAAMATAEADALANLLAGLDPPDDALRAVLDDLAREYGLDAGRTGLVDPDVVPELPVEPYVSRGSLYELGDHLLLCGDSTDASDVARLTGGGLADCLWTDPPYGVAYEGKTDRHLRIRNDDPETSDDVSAGAFRLASLGPSSPFYVSAPAGPRSAAFRAAIASVGWRLHQELVWVKGTIVLGHSDYQYAHEPILYGYTLGSGGRAVVDIQAAAGTATTARARSSSTRSPPPTATIRRPNRSRSLANASATAPGPVISCTSRSRAPGRRSSQPSSLGGVVSRWRSIPATPRSRSSAGRRSRDTRRSESMRDPTRHDGRIVHAYQAPAGYQS